MKRNFKLKSLIEEFEFEGKKIIPLIELLNLFATEVPFIPVSIEDSGTDIKMKSALGVYVKYTDGSGTERRFSFYSSDDLGSFFQLQNIRKGGHDLVVYHQLEMFKQLEIWGFKTFYNER